MSDTAPAVPGMPEIGVIAFVPDTWGRGVWQVRHQVLTRLSDYFHVLWVDPAIGWRNAVRESPILARFNKPFADAHPAFEVYRHSLWSAKFYRPPLVSRITQESRVATGVTRLRRQGCKRVIAYLWRPEYFGEIAASGVEGYCYHIDDEYTFSTVEMPTSDLERRVIEGADHVFVHSPGMMEKKGALNDNTTFSPNGVDVDLYSSDHAKPDDLADIRTPVIVYIGVLKSTLDWDLLNILSERMPEKSFVFVGPKGTLKPGDAMLVEDLSARSNVFFLGCKDVEELPAYTRHADICIMPYRIDSYTNYIFPIKVNEYLAAGKPTIGAPIRSLQDYDDLIDLATTSDEWISAINRNLLADANRNGVVQRRVERARKYDWSRIVGSIAKEIAGTAQYQARLDVNRRLRHPS